MTVFSFPAPLEVDRFLYNELYLNMILMKFPAPHEVDRGLYYATVNESPELQKFPAPREVDR